MTSRRDHPVTIAHRAGNHPDRLQAAADAGVDFVEADIRWDGEPVTRHERRLPFLPVYWDRWYARWDTHPPHTLDSLLARLGALRIGPYLDIKAENLRTIAAVLEALRSHDALTTVEIASQHWTALEELRLLANDAPGAPQIRLFRSVGHPLQMEALHRLLDDDPLRPAGIAINRKLLTPDLAAALREHGLDICVWGVEEREEAARLLQWGATGIIADDLELLRSLKGG